MYFSRSLSLTVAFVAPAAPMVAGRYRDLAARQVSASDETLGVARSTAKEATRARKPNYPYSAVSTTEAWRGRIPRVWVVSVGSRTSNWIESKIVNSAMKNI